MKPLPFSSHLTRRPTLLPKFLVPRAATVHPIYHHPRHAQPPPPQPQTRAFTLPNLSSFLPNNNSNPNPNLNNNDNDNNHRILKATRTLPYSPGPLYNTISSVDLYATFLPFLTASTVTARDAEGYPTRAILAVGYGPFSEEFTSEVVCDRTRWVVEARSGEDQGKGKGSGGGIFEYLVTRWQLVPLNPRETRVDLEIRFLFRSQMHAAMMGAVEGKMAGTMIEAFEERVREVEEK